MRENDVLQKDMWALDIPCDLQWLRRRKGKLGLPKFSFKTRSKILKGEVETLIFADKKSAKHFRFILHAETKEQAEQCINANIGAWSLSIETGMMLQTRSSFKLPRVDGGYGFTTFLSEFKGKPHITVYLTLVHKSPDFDAAVLGLSMALWKQEMQT